MIFIKTLEPQYSMIKYHPPYFNEGDTSVEDVMNGTRKNVDEFVIKMILADIDYVKTKYGLDIYKHYKEKKHVYVDNSTCLYVKQDCMPKRSTA